MIGTPYWTLEFNDVIGIAMLGLLGRKIFFSALCNSIFTSEGLSAILFSVSSLYDHYLDHSVRVSG